MSRQVKPFEEGKRKFLNYISRYRTVIIVISAVLTAAAAGLVIFALVKHNQSGPEEAVEPQQKAVSVMTVEDSPKQNSILSTPRRS